MGFSLSSSTSRCLLSCSLLCKARSWYTDAAPEAQSKQAKQEALRSCFNNLMEFQCRPPQDPPFCQGSWKGPSGTEVTSADSFACSKVRKRMQSQSRLTC